MCAGLPALHAQPVADGGASGPAAQQVPANGQATDNSSKNTKDDGQTDKSSAKTAGKQAKQLSTVVVTGLRASLMSAQERKRSAPQIIESVTALDIGALPDRSVTDTLSRMSGVTVARFAAPDDPDHPSAEGSGIQIRGMSQVRSELNGGDVFSANSGRGLSWQDVPSELLAGVDIYMNPNASITEGGLGGTVNLRTRLPFDQKGEKVAFNFGVNSGDLSHKGKPAASFLYSNRWETENYGEVGFLVDVAYSALASRSDGVQVEPYLRRDDPALLAGTDFTEVYVPNGVDWRTLNFERERIGIDAALQWRPSSSFEMSTQMLRSSYSMNWTEHAAFFNDSAPTFTNGLLSSTATGILPATGTRFQYDENGVFQSGSLTSNSWRGTLGGDGVRFQTDTRQNQQFTVTTDWSTKFKWDLSADTVVTGGVQFVKSTSRTQDFTVFDALYLPGFYIDVTSPASPTVSINPADFVNDKSNYFWSAAMDHIADQWAMDRAYHIDLKHYFDSSWARSVGFGLRTTNREEVDQSSPYHWGVLSDNWATLANTPTGTGLADLEHYIPTQSTWYNFSNFFRGDVNVPGMYAPVASLAGNRMQAYQDHLVNAEASTGWTPYGAYQPGDLNVQKEETQAAYGILYFGSPNGFLAGNVGVRVVRTDMNVNGSVRYPDTTAYDVPQAVKDKYYGQYSPDEGGRTYTNVLPSLNLRLNLSDQLMWRFAASKAMARPSFNQLKGYTLLGVTTSPDNTSIVQWTGTGGNADLKPMVAKQFDTSLEWYFGPAAHVYFTLFYKDIKNYISTQTETEVYDNQAFQVTRPYNHGTGKVRGAQFSYSQFFHFLPGWLEGFGVQANYTYVHSEGGVNTSANPLYPTADTGISLPMVGLSKNAYNFILMYEHSKWSGRLAWNWRSQYLLSTSDAATHLPVWAGARGALDASLFYRVNKHFQVGLRLNNLNNARTRVLMGPTAYADGTVDHRLYTRGTFVTDKRAELLFRLSL